VSEVGVPLPAGVQTLLKAVEAFISGLPGVTSCPLQQTAGYWKVVTPLHFEMQH